MIGYFNCRAIVRLGTKQECDCLDCRAGNLKDKVAEKRMSESFALVLSSEFSNQPLPSSQDWASFAKDTGLGEAVICTSRSGRDEKPQAFCGDVLFWLLMVPCESVRDPVFCLKESPILKQGGGVAGFGDRRPVGWFGEGKGWVT